MDTLISAKNVVSPTLELETRKNMTLEDIGKNRKGTLTTNIT